MKILLAPLDERPVNTRLVKDVSAIAGANIVAPPADVLPRQKTPGDADALCAWLLDTIPTCDAAVISVDMVVYGGLIASRTSNDDTLTVLRRLSTLAELHRQRPNVHVAAVSLVMRASDADVSDEEPDYWSTYGRRLHGLGAELHRAMAADMVGDPAPLRPNHVPSDVIRDFESRRIRNHIVNIECLRLYAAGALGSLAITSDDTAPWSAGSAEQLWLRHWRRALGLDRLVPMYPGADEVGAVLACRVTSSGTPPVRVRVESADGPGMQLVPQYENRPCDAAVSAQIERAGAVRVGPDEAADLVLVVHAPGAARGDWYGDRPTPEPEAAAATAALAEAALVRGEDVAVADARHTNGGDPLLAEELLSRGLTGDLAAYGGWNTASNAIGSVVAAAVMTAWARREGCCHEAARRRLVIHRLLEDVGYQSVIRTQLADEFSPGATVDDTWTPDLDAARPRASELMRNYLRRLDSSFELACLQFPWGRPFEVDFDLIERHLHA